MARLIEVQQAQECPSPLTLQPSDVLLFHAIGGQVLSGRDIVELWGPFLPAVLGDTGGILTPMGPPTTVLVRARQLGRARIEVITGEPFQATQMTALDITVTS